MTSCVDMKGHFPFHLDIWTAFKMNFGRGALNVKLRFIFSKSILFPKWKSDKTGSAWQHREASFAAQAFTANRLVLHDYVKKKKKKKMQNYTFEKKTAKLCLGYQGSLGNLKALKRQYHMKHRGIRNRKMAFLLRYFI